MIRATPKWVNGWPVIELDYDREERGHENIKQYLTPDQTERLILSLRIALNTGRMLPDWSGGKLRRGG